MIELRPVTQDNFDEVLQLSVRKDQQNFVASTVYSLAQAWLHDYARPFAIYHADALVGFCMLDVDKRENVYEIWRFLIDQRHQSKGYGRAAMALILEYLAVEGAKEITLSYEPNNKVADKLYRSFGFLPTGAIENGEIVMKLVLCG